MRLDQIETLSASKLNQRMLASIGWNFRRLENLNTAQISAMLESVNQNIAKLRNHNLFESQKNPNYNALLLAKRVLEAQLSEASKPDYLDLDGDGDTKEPMRKAAKDAKKKKTNESKRSVEPGAVATAQVKKMGNRYWTGSNLTKAGIRKRNEIIQSIEKEQGVNESKRTRAQVRKELDKVNDRIEKIVHDGGRVAINDPLSKQLRALKSELKSLKENRLHARLMEDSITNAEAIMAAQDMVDRIQGMLEDVGQMINEEIPPLADSIRGAIGASESDQFKSSVTDSLNSLMDAVRDARESMELAVRALSGEAPAPMSSPEIDMDDTAVDLDMSDEFDASDAATGGDSPLGREAR